MGKNTIGARLAQAVDVARVRVGLSYRELDTLAGLRSVGHSGHIARGEKPRPSAVTVSRLSRVLGCSPDWLVNGGKDTAPADEAIVSAVEAARARRARRGHRETSTGAQA